MLMTKPPVPPTAPKFQPLRDRVQFLRIKRPPPAPGEIIIPAEPSMEAIVTATGPKCQSVRPGMKVLVNLNVGQQLVGIDGKSCREDEILALFV